MGTKYRLLSRAVASGQRAARCPESVDGVHEMLPWLLSAEPLAAAPCAGVVRLVCECVACRKKVTGQLVCDARSFTVHDVMTRMIVALAPGSDALRAINARWHAGALTETHWLRAAERGLECPPEGGR